MMKRLAPVLFLVFAVLPLAAGLTYSLLYSLGIVGALSTGFTLKAWQTALTDRTLWASVGLSMGMAIVCVLLSTVFALGLLTALRPYWQRPRLRMLLHFPLAIPPIVAAFVSFQWLGSSGLLARFARQLHWIDDSKGFPPLINDPYNLGVAATLILLTFPFLLLLFFNHYEAARLPQLTQLAATLGASPTYIRMRVVWPVVLRRTLPALLLYGVFILGAYEVPLLLGSQSPAMLSVFIGQKFGRFNLADVPVAYAATVVYTLVVLTAILLFLRLQKARPAL